MTVEHYENFPVASLLLPVRLRPAVQAVYAFARSADDIADEGDAPPAARLAALGEYENALRDLKAAPADRAAMFSQLHHTVAAWGLPLQPLHDLLSAFRQDVTTLRYPSYMALLDYCARSANPVGRLMLYLYDAPSEENFQASDAICSALQLINFLQDVGIDWQKKRIYLPLDELARFGVSPAQIGDSRVDANWRALMKFQTDRTRNLMLQGARLALCLPGRIGWELRMVVQGGLRILAKIEGADFDVYRKRPTLGPSDWPVIAWNAMRMR